MWLRTGINTEGARVHRGAPPAQPGRMQKEHERVPGVGGRKQQGLWVLKDEQELGM